MEIYFDARYPNGPTSTVAPKTGAPFPSVTKPEKIEELTFVDRSGAGLKSPIYESSFLTQEENIDVIKIRMNILYVLLVSVERIISSVFK